MFNHQTKTVTFAALLLALSGIFSRLLGLIRDRLLAGHFGAGAELDIYFAAFRIPDFVYGVLIAGGITAAFLPLFAEHFQDSDQDHQQENGTGWSLKALDFTNNVLNCFLILLIIICGILAIFAPYLNRFVVPGFSPENRDLATNLARLMFMSQILLGISGIFSSILQYFNRFLVYALAPIFYNLGIIFGILFLVPRFGVYGLAFGVIIGAIMHLAIQIPAARNSGYKYKFFLDLKHLGLIKLFTLVIPRTIGIAADQINLVVITAIASALSVGSIAIFNFANNIQYFPIGIIGVSFAVSFFPIFSKSLANGRKEEFLAHFSSSFRQILFFIVPVSLLIFLLRAQIIRLILGTGQFGWDATRITAACLGAFCLGILAESLIPVISRAFFSFQDTKTPVIIGLIAVAANVVLGISFVFFLGFDNLFRSLIASAFKLSDIPNIEIVGLALGLSIASVIQLILLLTFLYKKLGDFKIKEICRSLAKILGASAIMAVSAYLTLRLIALSVNMQTFLGVLLQTGAACLVAVVVYLASAYLFRSSEVKTLKRMVFNHFNKVINLDNGKGTN